MDYNRYSAYGIGQRRQPNDALSFAPIRSGSGGSGGGGGNGNGGSAALDDNFRGASLSMNYGKNSNDFNINSQRYADIDGNNKYGSVQSNNHFGGGGGGGGGYSNFTNKNNQRFGNNNNHNTKVNSRIENYDDHFRGTQQQQQSSFLGRNLDQRFALSEKISRNVASNLDYMPPQQQQTQLSANMGFVRSLSDLNSYSSNNNNNNSNYNNSNNNTDNNQRFYPNNNNERNIDSFVRRSDNFNDNFCGPDSNLSQQSKHLSRNPGSSNYVKERSNPGASNYKLNNLNERYNNGGNFGYNERGFDCDFRGQQQQSNNSYATNFDNKSHNNNNNNHNYSNNSNNSNNNRSNPQQFRRLNNTGDALVMLETVKALMMKNQSNSQVGNNNCGFGQGGPPTGGIRKWHPDNQSGQKPNMPMAHANNRPQMPNMQSRPQRQLNNNSNHNNNNNHNNSNNNNHNNSNNNNGNMPQAPIIGARKPPAGANKFPGNRLQNPQQQQQQQKQHINNPANRINNSNNKQQLAGNQPATKNINGGNNNVKPKPVQVPPKTVCPLSSGAVVSQNTQAKSANNKQPEIKKETIDVKPKGQKRVAEIPTAPLTKAVIKRRKLAIKRGFLLGGFKLPYIHNNKITHPQPEDKSYAVMFFEQAPNYSTSGEELDDMEMAEIQDSERDGKNVGRTLVKRIRKRLHHEWTIMEEAKTYKSWQTWWTDYKWCENAIKEQLQTFGSINLRNCFIPDLPRLTTEQVVDFIVQQAQFGLEKNSDNYYNNMKSIFTLMNITFLENLKMPNTEKVQEMIRAVPNEFWSYKMRSMVYLWAQYLKISKTSSPSTEIGAKELQAIERDWKNPLFHWIAKQAFDELKAISEVEWPEHNELYANLESSAPTSS
ncbi:GH13679 [Drosophila grimshawi]|uniref:GH13679 n=1 Tax=Drosophila grimshawi TaxID=7222 RepID=B4JQD5_DROGR|nr:GH13679 [Drosophila grimshawi]